MHSPSCSPPWSPPTISIPDKIKLVFMDPGAKPAAVMEGTVDALLGGIDDQVFLIRAQGFDAESLRFADLGANTVGITVHTHEDTLEDNPDLVKRFVRASQRAWQAAIGDPQVAIDAAVKMNPTSTATRSKASRSAMPRKPTGS
jgi:NitT/TauT family transport system substrate-binding protein